MSSYMPYLQSTRTRAWGWGCGFVFVLSTYLPSSLLDIPPICRVGGKFQWGEGELMVFAQLRRICCISIQTSCSHALALVFFGVCVCVCVIFYLVSCYMQPEGPWQRLR